VIEAHDGAAGVAAAKNERPDLILMDIQLPKLDGYEATRHVKADPDLKNIPVIVVTQPWPRDRIVVAANGSYNGVGIC
jgi:two-component system, cell cycle response regulator DivK